MTTAEKAKFLSPSDGYTRAHTSRIRLKNGSEGRGE